jgi:hypothetical protein
VVRRFFRRQVRQESAAWLDPRSAMGRVDAAAVQVQRALAFLEFVEEQEPILRSASESLSGVRGRVQVYRRRLVRLGIATLVAATLLYVVLADPSGTRAMLPAGMPYEWAHLGLLAVVIVLIVAIVAQLRRFGPPR